MHHITKIDGPQYCTLVLSLIGEMLSLSIISLIISKKSLNEFFLWLRGGQEAIICVNIEAKHFAFLDKYQLTYYYSRCQNVLITSFHVKFPVFISNFYL